MLDGSPFTATLKARRGGLGPQRWPEVYILDGSPFSATVPLDPDTLDERRFLLSYCRLTNQFAFHYDVPVIRLMLHPELLDHCLNYKC